MHNQISLSLNQMQQTALNHSITTHTLVSDRQNTAQHIALTTHRLTRISLTTLNTQRMSSFGEDVSDSQTKPKTRARTKHRRHTGMQGQRRLILQPLKMGSLNSELKQAKKQINKLTALYNELQDKISTQLETSNMQLKHGLKIHIDKKLEAQEEVITTLQTKVVKLTDHNNALKSQITDLKQELRAHKNKSTPSHKTPKDTPHKQQCQQNVQQCLDKTGAVHTHTHTHTHTHARAHTHTHSLSLSHTHTHTHARTHNFKHTNSFPRTTHPQTLTHCVPTGQKTWRKHTVA